MDMRTEHNYLNVQPKKRIQQQGIPGNRYTKTLHDQIQIEWREKSQNTQASTFLSFISKSRIIFSFLYTRMTLQSRRVPIFFAAQARRLAKEPESVLKPSNR